MRLANEQRIEIMLMAGSESKIAWWQQSLKVVKYTNVYFSYALKLMAHPVYIVFMSKINVLLVMALLKKACLPILMPLP